MRREQKKEGFHFIKEFASYYKPHRVLFFTDMVLCQDLAQIKMRNLSPS